MMSDDKTGRDAPRPTVATAFPACTGRWKREASSTAVTLSSICTPRIAAARGRNAREWTELAARTWEA